MSKVLDIIKSRRSTRAYKEEQVTDEAIMQLLDAGRWAPSGHNMQPWHFTVVQDKELIETISSTAKDAFKAVEDEMINKMANNDNFNIFYKAPTVIIVSGKKDAITFKEDLSAAIQNMLLLAEEMGLGTCWNGFVTGAFLEDRVEVVKKALELPEGHVPFQAFSLGFPLTEVFNAPERKEKYYNFIR